MVILCLAANGCAWIISHSNVLKEAHDNMKCFLLLNFWNCHSFQVRERLSYGGDWRRIWKMCITSSPLFLQQWWHCVQVWQTRLVLLHQWCSWSLWQRAEDDHQGLGYWSKSLTPICKWHCTKATFKKWSCWTYSYEDHDRVHSFCYVNLLPSALCLILMCYHTPRFMSSSFFIVFVMCWCWTLLLVHVFKGYNVFLSHLVKIIPMTQRHYFYHETLICFFWYWIEVML